MPRGKTTFQCGKPEKLALSSHARVVKACLVCKFEANFLLRHINKQHNIYGIARGVLEIVLACRVSPCTWVCSSSWRKQRSWILQLTHGQTLIGCQVIC
jgi:hypothetical protein